LLKDFQMEREQEKKRLADEMNKEWEVKLKELTDMFEKDYSKKKKKLDDRERKVNQFSEITYCLLSFAVYIGK